MYLVILPCMLLVLKKNECLLRNKPLVIDFPPKTFQPISDHNPHSAPFILGLTRHVFVYNLVPKRNMAIISERSNCFRRFAIIWLLERSSIVKRNNQLSRSVNGKYDPLCQNYFHRECVMNPGLLGARWWTIKYKRGVKRRYLGHIVTTRCYHASWSIEVFI